MRLPYKRLCFRAGIEPQAIEEVIMGNVVSAGIGQAPSRQAAIHAGLPVEIPAWTINKVCGSGLKAVNAGRLKLFELVRWTSLHRWWHGEYEQFYLLPKARTVIA